MNVDFFFIRWRVTFAFKISTISLEKWQADVDGRTGLEMQGLGLSWHCLHLAFGSPFFLLKSS
jgi:hypothetical protein